MYRVQSDLPNCQKKNPPFSPGSQHEPKFLVPSLASDAFLHDTTPQEPISGCVAHNRVPELRAESDTHRHRQFELCRQKLPTRMEKYKRNRRKKYRNHPLAASGLVGVVDMSPMGEHPAR